MVCGQKEWICLVTLLCLVVRVRVRVRARIHGKIVREWMGKRVI